MILQRKVRRSRWLGAQSRNGRKKKLAHYLEKARRRTASLSFFLGLDSAKMAGGVRRRKVPEWKGGCKRGNFVHRWGVVEGKKFCRLLQAEKGRAPAKVKMQVGAGTWGSAGSGKERTAGISSKKAWCGRYFLEKRILRLPGNGSDA